MTMKFATCCWLLAALAGTTALAQTHPQRKPGHTVGTKTVIITRPEDTICGGDNFGIEEQPLVPTDPNPVWTYVEQMPTLPEANGMAGIVAALTRRLLVPPTAPNGRVFVKFEVNKEGDICHAEVVKGLRADLDSAVVTAVRQLPCFTPGKQGGKVVRVSMIIPVTIPERKQPSATPQ